MIESENELSVSKKLLSELKKHEEETLKSLQEKNFDYQQIDILMQPLICFRLGLEEEITHFENKQA